MVINVLFGIWLNNTEFYSSFKRIPLKQLQEKYVWDYKENIENIWQKSQTEYIHET